jgi:hypothetical protein
MANEDPASELAKSITKELTPAGIAGFNKYDPMPVIDMLKRLMKSGKQPPRLTDPLPRFDPRTGGIIEPPGAPMQRGNQK